METPQVTSISISSVGAEKESMKEAEGKQWPRPGAFSQCQGFWCISAIIPNIISFQNHFEARDDDIIVATKPKSGTTWLKALVFSIVNRTRYTPTNTPLLSSNPHNLVPHFEFSLYKDNQLPHLSDIPSPRLFATHLPYAALPETIKKSNGRIVYICRNPLDTIVSFWHFASKAQPDVCSEWPIEEAFEKFCRGEEDFGPFWDHMLGYWKQSLEKPDEVLFLKYEDLKKDLVFYLKKLAEFLGFPFSLVEEEEGVIEEISKLCSLSNLKDLEVNQTGKLDIWIPIDNASFFRKGEVGDWVNHFKPSMVERLDKLMQEKLSGSGLSFTTNQ